MPGPANQILKYYHLQTCNQIDSIIAQVDKLSELAARSLDGVCTVMFYRKNGQEPLIPVALQRGNNALATGLKPLEESLAVPGRIQCTAGPEHTVFKDDFIDGHAFRDQFARDNNFRYRLLLPRHVDDELRALAVTYWTDRPSPLDHELECLHLLLDVLVGTMSMADQLQTVNDYSIRLAELFSMVELSPGDLKYRELLSNVIQQCRSAVPAAGLCLLLRDVETGEYKVSEFFDSQPVRSEFTGDVAIAVQKCLAAQVPGEQNENMWYDLSEHFKNDCTALVALEINPDRNYHYVLAVWTRRQSGFTDDDLDLLAVFSLLAQTTLTTGLDVKHLHKSRRMLEKSSTRMADTEALAALTDMTSGIAHDFNNILGGIVGRIQLMKMRAGESEQPGLSKVEELAMEGAETIRRIQEFTTHVRHKKLEPIDLREVIEDCVNHRSAIWKGLAVDRNVTINTKISLDEAIIDGSREDLVMLLNKLLENAVENSPHGAVVELALIEDGKKYCLFVTDAGAGIPKEIRKRVFYPFFTTKNNRGAGMGLAIVHGIVVRHGGEVVLEEGREGGAVFRVSLNRAIREREDSDITRRVRRTDQLNILVVDDDKQIREILKDMLVIEGHSAVACSDGYSALEEVEKQKFDLVITDLGMPGMSGLDMAAAIHQKYPVLPIAMITGWGTQLDENEVSLSGVKTVLPKPFHLKDIKGLVKDLVLS